ncbi:hypothetical protein MMC21_001679 [Puttea exsequens]|nr:hypothetical protein [Puttea exsequens]
MNFSTPFSRSFVLYVLLTLPVINTWRMEHENCGEDPCAANPGFTEPDPAAMEFDGGQSAASDRSAGIGMEYESAYIQFESDTAKRDPDPGKISNRREVDSSIGSFGDALENVLNTNRAVPLFEFRGLENLETWELDKFANAVKRNVVDLYNQFGTAPRRRKKQTSNMRSPIQHRDNDTVDDATVDNACPVGCVLCDVSTMPPSVSAFMSTTTSPSSAPTTTPSRTDAPSPSPKVSIKPTCTVWLSNKSISIGNANEQDNGGPLRQQSFDAIKKHWPPSPAICDIDLASVDEIWTVVGGNMQEISVQYETQISDYSDDKTFNTMLDAGLSTWQ